MSFADFRGCLLPFHSFWTVDVISGNFLFGRGQLNIWFLLPSNLLVWLVPERQRERAKERQRGLLAQVEECLSSSLCVTLHISVFTQGPQVCCDVIRSVPMLWIFCTYIHQKNKNENPKKTVLSGCLSEYLVQAATIPTHMNI